MRHFIYIILFLVVACETTPAPELRGELKIVPATYGEMNTENCTEFEGKCLLLAMENFVAIKKPVYKTESSTFTIHVKVNKKTGLEINKITKRNVGKPLVVMMGDKVISAPVVREPITGGSFELSFHDQKTFNSVVSALEKNLEK